MATKKQTTSKSRVTVKAAGDTPPATEGAPANRAGSAADAGTPVENPDATIEVQDDTAAPVVEDPATTAKATRNIKKAQARQKEREEQIAEFTEEMEEGGPGRNATAAGEIKAFDVNPGFTSMDIAGIKDWFKEHIQWLRDKDATVTDPVVVAVTVPDTSGAQAVREVSAGGNPDRERKDELTVYEGTFKWRYETDADTGKKPKPLKDDDDHIAVGRRMEEIAEWQAKQPQTLIVQIVQVTEIDAWRDLAQQALARRYEV
jgi:hypothetical protein